MLLRIQEYSFKTGKGIAVSTKGKLMRFTYKQLKDNKALRIGTKVELINHVLYTTSIYKSTLYYVMRLFNTVRSKLWQLYHRS